MKTTHDLPSPTWRGLNEGQVLQRIGAKGAGVKLSGPAGLAGRLTATIFSGARPLRGWKDVSVGQAKPGTIQVRLDGIPAGGPYRLDLRVGGKTVFAVKTFFVGDVWILAGQSNMEGCGLIDGTEKTHPLVRAFSMRREWRMASEPMHLLIESPDACHSVKQCSPADGEKLRREATKGSGVGRLFAFEMLRRQKVPQGLICAAHGGTSMQQWNPERKNLGGESLYASMLASVAATGQPVAGVLWYQGESDANPKDAPLYTERMQKLVAASRRDLGQARLPWVIVQIARVFPRRTVKDEVTGWNLIQEEQRLLPDRVRNLETVAAIDLPLDDGIHIGAAGWPALAGRMARAMSRLAFGSTREGEPLRLRKVRKARYERFAGFVVDVEFDGVTGSLRSGGEPSGFTVVNSDGVDLAPVYKITLHGHIARVFMAVAGVEGLSLAYGHGTLGVCNIADVRGEALPVFGPIPLSKKTALLPFLRTWKVSGIVTGRGSLRKVTPREIDAAGGEPKTYESDFVNEHAAWEAREGHGYFTSEIELPEPMKLDVLMGYDGPFRLWLDGKLLFEDMGGINPAIIDFKSRPVSLGAGKHTVHVAMDLNNGRAWGFFTRFRRTDLSGEQILSGDYRKPVY